MSANAHPIVLASEIINVLGLRKLKRVEKVVENFKVIDESQRWALDARRLLEEIAWKGLLLEGKRYGGREAFSDEKVGLMNTLVRLLGSLKTNLNQTMVKKAESDFVSLKESFKNAVLEIYNLYLADKIDGAQMENLFKEEVEEHWPKAYKYGVHSVGNPFGVAPDDITWLKGAMDEEIGYFHNLVADITAGTSIKPIPVRLDMYAETINHAFNHGKVEGSPDFTLIHWKLNPAEHCNDCIKLEANGPYTKKTLPCVPGDGTTQCLSNCKCELVFEYTEKVKEKENFIITGPREFTIPPGLRLPTFRERDKLNVWSHEVDKIKELIKTATGDRKKELIGARRDLNAKILDYAEKRNLYYIYNPTTTKRERVEGLEEYGDLLLEGGPGSGNWGHAGRPGKRGGSLPGGGEATGSGVEKYAQKDWEAHFGKPFTQLTRAETDKYFFPPGSEKEGVADDLLDQHIDFRRKWQHAVQVAVALNQPVDPKTVNDVFYGDKIQDLPDVLYHVTPFKSSVEAQGLKTRDELGNQAAGLGGGTSDTISFTTDLKIAKAIAYGLREAGTVARGEVTPEMLMAMAKAGRGAKGKPFDYEIAHYYNKDYKYGEKYPRQLQDLFNGVERESFLMKTADAMPGWEPDLDSPHWPNAYGVEVYTGWTRKMSEEKMTEARMQLYKVFATFRESAGGIFNPLFFMENDQAIKNIKKEEVAILQFKPKPGAKGIQVEGEAEWRTWTGKAVDFVKEWHVPKHVSEIEYMDFFWKTIMEGGAGSGNWGHKGRPGKRGGSLPGKGEATGDIDYEVQKGEVVAALTKSMKEHDLEVRMAPSKGNLVRMVLIKKGFKNFMTGEVAEYEVGDIEVEVDLNVLYIAHMNLTKALRGLGIGGDAIKTLIEVGRKQGKDKLTLVANGAEGIGRYAWAVMGFDFDHPSENIEQARNFRKALVDKYGMSRDEVGKALPKGDSLHSWEIANFRDPKTGRHLGKQYLMDGWDYFGEMSLSPGSLETKAFHNYYINRVTGKPLKEAAEAGYDDMNSYGFHTDLFAGEKEILSGLSKIILRSRVARKIAEDLVEGGAGSGNWGHAGRPGKRGGSLPGSGEATGEGRDLEAEKKQVLNALLKVAYKHGFSAYVAPVKGELVFVILMKRGHTSYNRLTDEDFKLGDISVEVGKENLYIAHAKLAPQLQGHGIGGDFVKAVIDVGKAQGKKRVTLVADGDEGIGRYAWGVMGFDYGSPESAERVTTNFKMDLEYQYGWSRDKIKKAVPKKSMHAWEIAAFKDPSTGEATGKKWMIQDQDYFGDIDLSPGSESLKVFENYYKNRSIRPLPKPVSEAVVSFDDMNSAGFHADLLDGEKEILTGLSKIILRSRLAKKIAEDLVEGGVGSGNWGHAGRPGKRGGSLPGSGEATGEDDEFNFKTSAEAEEWMKAHYPNIQVAFKHLKPETINPTIKQFDKLAKEYPEVLPLIGKIEEWTLEPGVFIRTEPVSGRESHGMGSLEPQDMLLNYSYYGHPSPYQKVLKWAVKKKIHPEGCDTFESMMTHEFGHIVQFWMENIYTGKKTKVIDLPGDPAKTSKYAEKNEYEEWAEAFSMLYHTPKEKWSEQAKNLKRILDAWKAKRREGKPMKEWASELAAEILEGGVGSGNWGHRGRPGRRGGSLPGGGDATGDIDVPAFPGQPYKKFGNKYNAIKWAKQVYPDKEFQTLIYADDETVDEILGAFHQLANDYPEVMASVDEIRIQPFDADDPAFAKAGRRYVYDQGNRLEFPTGSGRYKVTRQILLNESYWMADGVSSDSTGKPILGYNIGGWKRISMLREQLKKTCQEGNEFHPVGCDSLKAVIDHEFGHFVLDHYYNETDDNFLPYQTPDGFGSDRDALDRFRTNVHARAKQTSPDFISKYAIKNIREAFSEGFSVMRNRPPETWPRYVKKQSELIELLHKYHYPKRPLGSAPPEEKAAIIKGIPDLKKLAGLKDNREYRSPTVVTESYLEEGGVGSGNWGHKGRPGKRGGSLPGGGNATGEAPPWEPYKPFKKVFQAVDWAKETYPGMDCRDLYYCDADTVNEILNAFHKLAYDYPEVAADVGRIGVRSLQNQGSWAEAGEYNESTDISNTNFVRKSSIDLAMEWWKAESPTDVSLHITALQRDIRRCEENGFHPNGCGTLKSVIDHEFGHLVENYYLRSNENFLPIQSADGFGIENETISIFTKEVFPSAELVSDYALKNPKEAFAEAFAMMRNTRKTKDTWPFYVRAEENLLKRFKEGNYGTEHKFVSDLPIGPEREKATKEINAVRREVGVL